MRNINEINTELEEGRLLIAALSKLSTESQTDKTPYEVLEQLNVLSRQIYE